MTSHPMQPIAHDSHGVVRFKRNGIIDDLVRRKIIDLNDIDVDAFPVEDVEQLWQLMGYSVSGYGDLSFVRPETIAAADAIAAKVVAEGKAIR
jgi:hypothetical protein